MKCPKCRSEVGNQPVCPYCGGTIYIQAATTGGYDDYSRRVPGQADPRPQSRSRSELRELERRMRSLETKVSLTLVLQCGSFALMILTLVILALK